MSRDEVSAEVRALARKVWSDTWTGVTVSFDAVELIEAGIMADRDARTPSTDQRAREEAAEDERDRLFELALREMDDTRLGTYRREIALHEYNELEAEGAMLPADRQRDRDSKTGEA